MIRKYAISAAACAALVLGAGSAPALAGDLAPATADPTSQRSIVELYNTWMFCEEAWLVSLDQMYPEGFSVSQCMDILEAHRNHGG